MLATAIIVFREVLEAALIVSIVMAACRGLAGRGRWVGTGVAAGLAGAAIVASFAGAIASAAAGIGQELLNAAILFLAVAMLGWHSVWMSRHGRELARQVGKVGRDVIAGARPLYALAIVTGAAVLREGSETVLFLYGIAASDGGGAAALLLGGLVGIAGGVAVGVALYRGLLRIPMKHLFSVTNWMILLLAAGMASQGAGFLVQADLLPPLGVAVWDTSAMLTEDTILGKALHTLVGYVARPAGIQVAFYLFTLVTVGLLTQLAARGEAQKNGGANPLTLAAAALAALGLGLAALSSAARADFKVRAPLVIQGEVELEHAGSVTFDRDPDKRNERSFTASIGYGVTGFWKTEIEGEWEREAGFDPATRTRFVATTWENTFQLTPQGKYFADLGFFFEYSRADHRDAPDAAEFGPLAQFETRPLVHTVNALFVRDIGRNGEPGVSFEYAWQTKYPLFRWLDPGVEFYGEPGRIGHFAALAEQAHRGGPVLFGVARLADLGLGDVGTLKYEVGYLFGLTHATPHGTVKWLFEYELFF